MARGPGVVAMGGGLGGGEGEGGWLAEGMDGGGKAPKKSR